MKKSILVVLAFSLMVASCGKKEPIRGFVGNPLHLSAVVEAPEDTLGCTYRWVFTQKPPESNLDILSFQPDSRSFSIYFVPDVAGQYTVQNAVVDAEGKDKSKNDFICEISIDSTGEGATDTTGVSESAPAPVYESGTKQKAPSTNIAPKKESVSETVQTGRVKGKAIPKVSGKYTIQISSWQNYNAAEKELTRLSNLGLDAYIQKAIFKETKETWYRIRVGMFDSHSEATSALNDFRNRFPNEKFWIDNVRQD
ncbi:MAG: SPOR domain-containing protein [Candidatus Marinimicrobia bacterium]|nr:SPOR domain-containing protein [Candidatus Neomarinimicrobiota bacterium]